MNEKRLHPFRYKFRVVNYLLLIIKCYKFEIITYFVLKEVNLDVANI